MEYSNLSTQTWDMFKEILDFCPETCITEVERSKKNLQSSFYKNCERLLNTVGDSTIAISISGGVDSMLLSYFCSLYANISGKKVILIHINYNNRASCDEEVKFLKQWAHILQVDLHVHNMKITRERQSKLREEYESITKEIRFNFYKSFQCPILLGHNKDDCYENVFANLSKQIHFENLFGMNETLMENEVLILRPFLGISKKVYLIKLTNCVFLIWRILLLPGLEEEKMRDSLIPVIESFDQNILKGMDQFVEHTIFTRTVGNKFRNLERNC